MIGTVYSVLNIIIYDIKLQWRALFWKVKIGVEWIALTSSHNTVKLVTPVLFVNFFTGLLESLQHQSKANLLPQPVISLLC